MLEHAFEHARSGLALVDGTGHILRVNAAGAAIIGRTPDELVGELLQEFLHADDVEAALSALLETLPDGHAGPIDLRVLLPDGTYVWLRAKATGIPSDPAAAFVEFEDAGPARAVAEALERTTRDLQREHEELSRRGAALADLAALVTTVDDLDGLITGIADLATDHLGPLVAVALVEEEDRRIRWAHVTHRDDDLRAAVQELLPEHASHSVEPVGVLGEVVLSGVERVNFAGPIHPALPPLTTGLAARFPPGPRLIMPMRTPEGPIGALVVVRGAADEPFSSADVDLAAVLASRTAVMVLNARLDAQRRRAEAVMARRAAQQAAVAQLGTLALEGAGLEEVAERCRKLVEDTLEVVHCGVLVDDGHPDGLLLLASSERFTPQVGGYRRPTDPALQAIFDSEGSFLVPDLANERRFAPNPTLRHLGVRSMAVARIESRSAAHGLLSAGSEELDAFRIGDLTFLDAMANVLASAIDAKHALDGLRHNAVHDALTGLPNRVLLQDRLALALEQAAARGTQVAVLVCDVDRFKVVNDGLGHAAGDEVLQVVAERLRAQVRPGDTVGRFGGDEFVVVCPDVGELADVIAIADRLSAAFAEPMEVLGSELVATASIGIAVGAGDGPDAASSLLRDADAAMYRAKDRGRARYELFDDDMRARWRAVLATPPDAPPRTGTADPAPPEPGQPPT
jgi:diguanylate cyclase (GGDEF)-like protein/PAS domain S-box-containing protein